MEIDEFKHNLRTRIQAPIREILEACKAFEQEQNVPQSDELNDSIYHIRSACGHVLEILDDFLVVSDKLSSSGIIEAGEFDEGNNNTAGLLYDVGSPIKMVHGFSQIILGDVSLTENQRVIATKIRVEAQSVSAVIQEILGTSAQSHS